MLHNFSAKYFVSSRIYTIMFARELFFYLNFFIVKKESYFKDLRNCSHHFKVVKVSVASGIIIGEQIFKTK